jgi:UDPglucose 6-dehydrogenase
VAYDPAVRKVVAPISVASDNFRVVESSYEAVDGADMLFLLTEWREFMSPDFRRVFDKMRQPVVFDGRNIWKPESLKSRGFTYFSIGR